MRLRHTGPGLRMAGLLWLVALVGVIVTETPTRVLVASGVLAASTLIGQWIKRRRLGALPLVRRRPLARPSRSLAVAPKPHS
jgi:hypothetical protein